MINSNDAFEDFIKLVTELKTGQETRIRMVVSKELYQKFKGLKSNDIKRGKKFVFYKGVPLYPTYTFPTEGKNGEIVHGIIMDGNKITHYMTG